MFIQNYNANIGTATWTFDVNGNLSLAQQGNIVGVTANNSGSLRWVGNSSGDGYGYTTLELHPDDTLSGLDQYLIIDPTSPGHVHIRAGGTQDNSQATLFLGGENSYVEVGPGLNPPVVIASNMNSWQFGTDGNLTAPGSITANTFMGAQANVDVVAGTYNWTFDNTGNLTLPNISGTIEGSITTINGALQLRSNTGTEMDYYDSADENHFGYISIEDRKSTRLNSSHVSESRMPSSA